jgi:HEAT repeat protein/tRNA A-37 threonylcarbamoyl transferase component Bud32
MRLCTSCRRLLKPDAIRCPHDGAAVEDVEALPEGTKLGVYRIDRMLGEGGMGFVYAATHEVLSRRSAIKMLRPELLSNEQIVTRFLNEAKAVNLIDHPNIVNVYDYGDGGDGSVYFVMEFLEGETLDDLMRKRQAMAVPLFLHLFTQIAKALIAAHAKYIVHRDLKPANIYVVPREDNPAFVKLLDFGIAQLRGAGAVQGLTVMGSVMGTPQYMSPEQVTGGAVDARADVWAMGVMMYRAISGQAPFKGEEFAELASKILYSEPQPVGELVKVPAQLAKLIASCLERRLEARCQSIAELLAGLERVKQECRLDDEAILYAAAADIEANAGMVVGSDGRPITRGSLAGSMPRFQGAGAYVAPARAGGAGGASAGAGAAVAGGSSKLPRMLAVGGGLAAIAVAGYLVLGRTKEKGAEKPPEIVNASPPAKIEEPAKRTIKAAFDEGKADEARALAERELREAIGGANLQRQGFAVDALAMVRVPATAPLLYTALDGPPDVRIKAARALAELRLPDAAAKVRAALGASGDKVRVELAAALVRLGGKDAKAILTEALEAPTTRVLAGAAMAEAGDADGREALTAALQEATAGGEQWRKAAGALTRLGDAAARKLLEGELAQPNAARAVAAAELLARAGDAGAKEYLARVMADAEFARRGEAALALARLDDKRALGWVAAGLSSTDLDERRHALAVCGTLANAAAEHTPTIAAMATEDPELRVRLTAEAALLGMGGS